MSRRRCGASRQSQQPDRDAGETQTRYVTLVRVARATETVVNALIQQAHKLPRELYKSMTRGRGKELADVDDAERARGRLAPVAM